MAGDYDYIVVASGVGGGPLVANLARTGFSDILVEAGGDSCDATDRGTTEVRCPYFPRAVH